MYVFGLCVAFICVAVALDREMAKSIHLVCSMSEVVFAKDREKYGVERVSLECVCGGWCACFILGKDKGNAKAMSYQNK